VLGAGCSAGMSACPWPRPSPRYVSHHRPAAMLLNCVGPQVGRGASHCWPARPPDSASGSQPYRRLSGDCLRVLMRLRLVKPRVPQRDPTERIPSPKCGLQRSHTRSPRRRIGRDTGSSCRCKERQRNATELLAAGRKTVSFGQCRFDWSGDRPRSKDGRSTSCPDNLTGCLQLEIANRCR
jgi:hypothetical protein